MTRTADGTATRSFPFGRFYGLRSWRLPEEYNWFFDRQKRIGGRCAVFAKLDICGQAVGVVSTHLENRTDGAGRQRQMQAVLDEADRVFPDIPVIVGGDLNTNTFDGRNVVEISRLADNPALLEARVAQIGRYEPLMTACAAARLYSGFRRRYDAAQTAAAGRISCALSGLDPAARFFGAE